MVSDPLSVWAIGAFVLVFISSAALTGLVYIHARRKQWLAIPNARSSHAVPTPSSGGIGLAVVSVTLFAILGASGTLDRRLAIALVGGGIAVAFVGWIDDRQQLRARTRIIVQALAAAWALWWIGGLDHFSIGNQVIPLGGFGNILAILAVVAFGNLSNFMDGIDGLVGAETIVVGFVLAFLSFLSGMSAIAAIVGIIVAASLGFLVWNWHPAKIFMGDVGSVFLGFSFAVLAVASEQAGGLPSLVWAVLFAPIIVDAGFTTIRRALRGERWYEAHRTFSYQRAVQAGHRHSTVVLGAMLLNVVFAALAVAAWWQPAFLLPAVVASFLLATIVWARYQFARV